VPITRSRKILGAGQNYASHAAEMGASADTRKRGEPLFFAKLPTSVIASGEPIVIPAHLAGTRVDHEAELAVIIGRQGRSIAPRDALDFVWGYTIVNDVTARDLQGRYSQWLIGKSQDTFCPMGPVAVTADEMDLSTASVRCFVNGDKRQDQRIADLIFDIPTLIATLSEGITLNPGDIIATGTPAGVGIGHTPPIYLKAGDVVRVEIDGIGTLENRFVDRA
jgi:2-keto-4-pentenoate hydratase/2-oxohepta-3-ene-1,7-dioic acid hydratase in catechol pathway